MRGSPETAETPVVAWTDAGRAALVARAEQLLLRPGRSILGITGAPGAGKSTISAWLLENLSTRHPEEVALLPMDGFHLAQAVLDARGLADRKGAPETFDADGYLGALRRVREESDRSVFVPEFRRSIEEPVAGAIEIPPTVRLVITEGNYLLLDAAPWSHVAPLLDESWFVHLDPDERLRRLTERHMRFGDDLTNARRRTHGSDERNARLIAIGAQRCTTVIEYTPSLISPPSG
jgi:Panthothenate kinase